jgi:hypothetical protein
MEQIIVIRIGLNGVCRGTKYPGKDSAQSRSMNLILKLLLKSILSVSIMPRSDKADSNISNPSEVREAQPLLSSLTDRGVEIDCNDEHPGNVRL